MVGKPSVNPSVFVLARWWGSRVYGKKWPPYTANIQPYDHLRRLM